MKYSQSEKMEIIRMVEESNLSVRCTLRQIDISRSTFYEWYRRYQEHGYEGLAPKHRTPLDDIQSELRALLKEQSISSTSSH